ncbi:MAG: hypothetical protein WBA10_17665 [Elainellaceae cyanobacterium]
MTSHLDLSFPNRLLATSRSQIRRPVTGGAAAKKQHRRHFALSELLVLGIMTTTSGTKSNREPSASGLSVTKAS